MKKNSQLAHRMKSNIYNNPKKFHKFMLEGHKCITEKQIIAWEDCYFALCLLIPEKQFLDFCDVFGGIDVVRKSNEHIHALARLFLVEPIMITTRIDLIKQGLEEEKRKKRTIRLYK